MVDSKGKGEVIEDYFKVKFQTSSEPGNKIELADEENLGVPKEVLSMIDSLKIMKEISIDELKLVIDSLQSGKAEGLDEITPEMFQNLPLEAVEKLLELFNNILMTGVVPEDWKKGNVVLIHKRPPSTDIMNYRPITFISVVSKLLTKILAKRISVAVENSNVLNETQNGFRTGRRTADNLFILTSLLEQSKVNKKSVHMMFIDLQVML